MIDFTLLDLLNRYSNLVLVAVTGVYVWLTWRMVREMRRAREAELEPYLVASIEPFGPQYAKIRVQNVGAGPALETEITISVLPANPSFTRIWRHPVTWPRQVDEFRLPDDDLNGELLTMPQAVQKYSAVMVDAVWRTPLGKRKRDHFEFELSSQMDGWYKSAHFRYRAEPAESLEKIDKDLSEIHSALKSLNSHLGSIASAGWFAVRSRVEEEEDSGEGTLQDQ